jgi:CDP-diacylglycerol--serine O-phosphatidyltransferase
MNEEKKILGYYDYTVILTYIGMICGVIGISNVMCEKFSVSIFCLMIAGVCDMFDGTVAATKKRTDSEKKFGIQIDSLSDLICFGVLPGLFVYEFSGRSYIGMGVAAFYVLCALIRLAYFNVSEEERQKSEGGTRKYYQGLPVTSVALLLPAAYIFTNNIYIYISLIPLMGILFLVPFKLRKPKTFGKAVLGILGIAELFVLILGVIGGV